SLDHQVEGPPHRADRVHAVEDPTRAEPILGGLVTLAHLPERVGHRHSHVLVLDLAVVGVGAAPDADASHDVHALGGGRHDDLHHVPAAALLAGGVLDTAHDDEEVGADAVAREPFVAVDDP